MSPKAKVTYDQHKFEVEFNVTEYLPEELSIKTEGDVLIVLAKHETKAEGGHSYISKQFEQRFSLPSGVKPEKISSKLSKEGVLTVTAPRENLAITNIKKSSNATGSVYNQSEETKQNDGLPHPRVSYDDDKFQISLDAAEYKPEDLDVRVEGNTIIITAKQEIQETGGVRTRVFEQKFSMPSGVKPELVKSSLTREGVLVITAPRGNPSAQSSYTTTESVENKMNKVMDPSTWDKDTTTRQQQQQQQKDSFFDNNRTEAKKKDSFFDDSKELRKKDSFFDDSKELRKKDSFFDDSERAFEERRKEFFDDFHKDSLFADRRRDSAFDDMRRDSNSFNNSGTSSAALSNNSRHASIFDSSRSRDRNVFDEDQGQSRVVYEDDMYKILINVEKYLPEELMIKTIDNNVVVEAKHEEKTSDGRSYSTQSFNQSFNLPRGVNPESVTSSLSKTGVLTISAPLPKPIKTNTGERMIPIKHN